MDGIAGIVYPDPYQMTHLITPMLKTLKHRGGEAQKTYTFKNIQIGAAGNNLQSNSKKSVFCVADAEINNAFELRKALKQANCHTPSEDTTQLLIQAYETWGVDFIKHITGYFAIAILDQKKKQLYLFRDRIGKKPLYWYRDQHHFIFASELKALLATGAVPQTPAFDALSAYFYFGYIPQDMSPIKGVNKLLPGHFLKFDEDASIRILSYWSYSSCFSNKIDVHNSSAALHFNRLLLKSVSSRLEQNCPVGCFVSGGLGSASIAYSLCSLYPKELVSAYTVEYSAQNEEDTIAATTIADTLMIRHEIEKLTPENFLDDLPKIMWYLDEPLADPNITATWRLAEIAKRSVNLAFSGMGSDELLAGHNRYTTKEQIQSKSYLNTLLQIPTFLLRIFILPILTAFTQKVPYHLIKSSRTNPWQLDYLKQTALFSETDFSLMAPNLSTLFDPEVFLHKFHHIDKIQSKVSSLLYFDVKTRLPDCFMLQYERLTAAHSLGWMAPYLDKPILEYLASLLEPDYLEERDTAQFLKIILRKVFPDQFINRPKRTRPDFLSDWVEISALREIFPRLSNGILVESGIISASWINFNTRTPELRRKNFSRLWSIFALEVWFRLYIRNPIATTYPETSIKELLL